MENKYEAIFILRGDIKSNEIEQKLEQINNMITSEKCEIFNSENMGLKNLVCKIKDCQNGWYYYVEFKTNIDRKDLDRKISMKINTIDIVIKHIIIKKAEDRYKEGNEK